MSRKFEFTKAKRTQVPMLVGLFGPSNSGKTMSALRLATGMQRVTGGQIHYIDTEARRACHYADRFDFEHLDFQPPFGPADYQAAIEHCVANKASIVIVDSMSHEHEGPGGVLEQHDAFLEKRAGNDWKKREKLTFSAWIEPKKQRVRLINTILQLGCNVIFCFRAKEKMKIRGGQEPLQLGWQPIGGDEYLYEMLVSALLPPASNGVPDWTPSMPGEKQMVKLPDHFREIFPDGAALCEAMGESLAKWAQGGSTEIGDDELADVVLGLREAADLDALNAIRQEHSSRAWSPSQRLELRKAFTSREEQLKEQSSA